MYIEDLIENFENFRGLLKFKTDILNILCLIRTFSANYLSLYLIMMFNIENIKNRCCMVINQTNWLSPLVSDANKQYNSDHSGKYCLF